MTARALGTSAGKRSRSIPTYGAVPAWGSVQSSSHGTLHLAAETHDSQQPLPFPYPASRIFELCCAKALPRSCQANSKDLALEGIDKLLCREFSQQQALLAGHGHSGSTETTSVQELGLFHCTLQG